MKRTKTRYFTLVELLVVLSIIVILAAVVMIFVGIALMLPAAAVLFWGIARAVAPQLMNSNLPQDKEKKDDTDH